MSKDVILSVKDLYVNFYTNMRCNRALRGVSFDLYSGKTHCFVGESGCGKSVTANSIMGLLPDLGRIESGTISYFGKEEEIHIDQLDKNSKQMRNIRGKDLAMIFQDPMTSLNPVMKVGKQVAEMIKQHMDVSNKECKEMVIKLFKQMGISLPEQRYNEYAHQFSGGMRQRAMIAMAMACSPKVLIADEPTTALDVTIQAQIFELMQALKDEYNMAIMLITHDMGVVAELADNVSVMYMGNIVESGTAEQVLGNPKHPYTKALIESIPILGRGKNQKLEPIRGQTPDPYSRPDGCQFATRCDYAFDDCYIKMPCEITGKDGHMCRCFLSKE